MQKSSPEILSLNPKMYEKNYIPWPSGIYPRYIKHTFSKISSNLIFRYLLKWNENVSLWKNLYMNAYRNLICHCLRLETSQMFFIWIGNRGTSHHRILSNSLKGSRHDKCQNTHESQINNIKWRCQTEKDMYLVIQFIWYSR